MTQRISKYELTDEFLASPAEYVELVIKLISDEEAKADIKEWLE